MKTIQKISLTLIVIAIGFSTVYLLNKDVRGFREMNQSGTSANYRVMIEEYIF